MIVFHTLWDLDYFAILPLSDSFYSIGVYFASLFFCLVGISLVISHKTKKEHVKRGLYILLLGFLLSLTSFILFPDRPIIFGALHLIGFSIIVGSFLIEFKYNLLLGLSIIFLGWLYPFNLGPSLDYFPIFPFFGVSVLGMGLGQLLYKNRERQFSFSFKPVTWLSEHSLYIYLIHQPVIVGSILCLKRLL